MSVYGKFRPALIKPKLTAAEKKIIGMVIDGLPSENSRQAYQRALQEFSFGMASKTESGIK